jgi:predicted glycosyltransferase
MKKQRGSSQNRYRSERTDAPSALGLQVTLPIHERGARNLRGMRIVLYSHDTMGLGHVRRNLLIAQTLATCHLQANVLIVSGAREAGNFITPPGVEIMVLPSVKKETDGNYQSKRLKISLNDLIDIRGKIICSGISAFEPNLLIVDNVPRGVSCELDQTLEYLQLHGNTRCVLGLREVQDTPATVFREWSLKQNENAILNYYDEVWVYGDASLYDPVKEYGFSPDVAAKVIYTGYLDQKRRLEIGYQDNADDDTGVPGLSQEPFVLCMVGGGQDGAHLAQIFIEAELPRGVKGILLTGPYMEEKFRRDLSRDAAKKKHMRVLNFVSEPDLLLERADCVISMGGYNSVTEILSFEKRALIIPRVVPRKEQLIRAQYLEKIGAIDMLHPDQLDPHALTMWIKSNTGQLPKKNRDHIDMGGLTQIPKMIETLLTNSSFFRRSKETGGISRRTMLPDYEHEINNPNSVITFNAPLIGEVWKDVIPILLEHYRKNGEFFVGGVPFSEMCDTMPKLIGGILDGSKRIKDVVNQLKKGAK